ncbi:MAG: tetratricopeptide repeat protein, partial [Myxococcales bacterium]|nr:tetratricopeptide repeat protein [Myxococcales bacterium]
GRVRVADFGLAWTGAEVPDNAPTERRALDDATTLDAEAPLTETGAVLGTLAYMAPEQYRASAPSVAADIFSFCVSLHRALYGRLPYDTDSPALYRARALAGEVVPAGRGAAVPGWLRAVVLRGLAVKPEERWGSMAELVAALRRPEVAPQRRRGVLLGVAGLGVAGVALGLALVGGDAREGQGACAAPEVGLAGIWDGPTRERLGRRVRATSAPADPSRLWRSVDRLLDLYADRWLLERTRACQVGSSGGEAPLAGPLECLDRGREQLAAVVQQLDGAAIDAESAVLAVTGLPAPELCREAPPGALVATAEPHRRRQALAAAKAIARASADVDVGRLAAARSGVAETLEIAEAIASPALAAEAELTRGRIERAERHNDAARATLERARARIHGAPEHRALELRALIQLIDVVGVGQGELTEAEALAVEARALADELGDPPLLEAYLENNLARVLRAHGRLEAASAGYLDAYALLRQVLGDSAPETIATRANLGVVQSLLGEPEAVAILEHALEQQLSVLGEDHPRTPAILRNLGNALGRRGAYVRAEAVLRRAAELRAAIGGDNSPELAGDLISLARVLRGQERLEDADAALRRAAEIFAAAGEPRSSALDSERRALDAALARAGAA